MLIFYLLITLSVLFSFARTGVEPDFTSSLLGEHVASLGRAVMDKS